MANQSTEVTAASRRLERLLRTVALTGLALALLLPGAHGSTELLGWTPLWLAGLPMTAWWSLHRFRLPSWPVRQQAPAAVMSMHARPGRGAQARRRRQRMARPSRAA